MFQGFTLLQLSAQTNLVSLEMADIPFPKEFLFLASFLRSFFIIKATFFPILICFITSSLQKAVDKLKVAMHHRPPALQAKIVIFW